MIHGLSAFPLTPMNESSIDLHAFAGLVERLAAAAWGRWACSAPPAATPTWKRPSACACCASVGPFGRCPGHRRHRCAAHPRCAGIGPGRGRCGAAGLLLAPVSYQPLKEHGSTRSSNRCARRWAPICVYDNPGTTHFRFSDELRADRRPPNIASIKIPRLSDDPAEAAARVTTRAHLQRMSRWASAATAAVRGLRCGCDAGTR